jgi:PAS domain S-box-containing protein
MIRTLSSAMLSKNEELKKSDARFFQVFEHNPVGMVLVDYKSTLILYVNEAFLDTFEYTREEVIGKTSMELSLISAPDRAKLIDEVIKNEFAKDIELEARKKNGDTIFVLVSLQLIDIGNEKFVLNSFHDISTQKETERQLRIAKKNAEEANLLKETFLANMSHEIRTPMNAIIGFTDLLVQCDLRENEREYVDTIKKAGKTLLSIIDDILDSSKIEAGLTVFEEHPLSVAEIFTSLQSMLSEKAREKSLDLSFYCSPEIPNLLLGDVTRLTQVIINLTGNALKFTQTGMVNVTAKLLNQDINSCTLEFSVRDTGIGIPVEMQEYIFERFKQSEAHTTRKYGGTGLGLSISKQLVELQGGKISVSSEPGNGSVFTFRLPFKKTDATYKVFQKEEEKYFDIKAISKLNILLAEDNLVNIALITHLFNEGGIKLDVAKNGRIAVDMIRNHTYDLVLMDMEMPEMSGYQATKVLRQENNAIPIIAMTAHAMAGEREKCLRLGMNEYISKPINANLLFVKIYNIIYGNKVEDPIGQN